MTVRLFSDDLSLLREAYPHSGYNEVIRALVSKHCRALRSVTAEKLEGKLTSDELAAL